MHKQTFETIGDAVIGSVFNQLRQRVYQDTIDQIDALLAKHNGDAKKEGE